MHKKLRSGIALLLALAALLACAGCGLTEENGDTSTGEEAVEGAIAGEKLTLGYAADRLFSLNYDSAYSFNPLTSTSALNLEAAPLMYEPLVELDEYFAPQPKLLESWSSPDGLNWTFTVSNEYSFHDGTAFTAYDAYYTVLKAMRSTQYATRLSCVAGVSATGDTTLLIRLTAANTQFPALLNIPAIRDGQIDQWVPDGCGPYMMDSSGTKLALYSGHPDVQDMPIDEIYLKEYGSAADIITAYEDSLVDLVSNDPNSSSNLGYGGTNEIRYYNTTNMHFVAFNMDSGFFRFASYRAAMNHIVNRSYITTNVMGGCAVSATLPASPLFALYNNGFAANLEYSTEKCLAALNAAGISDMDGDGLLEYLYGGTPAKINIVFIVNGESEVKVAASRKIADDMEDLGFVVTLRELSWSDYKEALKDGDYDMYYGEVKMTADFDPSCLLAEDGAARYGETTDPNYGVYITNYLTAADDTRQMHADLMWQYIVTTAPIVTVCFEKRQVVTHRNVVSGMTPIQGNLFYKFSGWTINLSGE